ncbi:MAG: DNA alkylation repair protein [Bacteroidaceae bacterium]|nr:DNA alkylation repair protein [Bacteroidaceae bacterium]
MMSHAMNEENTAHEKSREIKKELRLAMNGVVSALQRKQGLSYKINFGVEIPRLKAIAAKFSKDEELARRLWEDDIRECKMLAIMLMPQEAYPTVAEKWISEAPFTEIADHLAMTILCKLPNAAKRATEWLEREEGMFRYCGFLTLSNLMRSGTRLTEEEKEAYLGIAENIESRDTRKAVILAARNSLIHYSESLES